MNSTALLASAAFLLIGSAFVACVPGAPDGTDEEVSDEQDELAQFCGGIAGFGCPDGKVCVDNPHDDCDPDNGGADCGGLCRPAKSPTKKKCQDPDRNYVANSPAECAVVRFFCAEGTPFFDACGCGCDVSAACSPSDCGPALGMPNTLCADGVSFAGPTGNCLATADGGCGWEVLSCP